MRSWKRYQRWGVMLALGAVVSVGACDAIDALLEAENPARILEEELDDEKLVPVLVNTVIGEFTNMYDDPFIWRGSMFTDEQITGINWEQTARLSQRIVRYNEGDADGMFTQISQARQMGDSVSSRLRKLLKSPNSDPNLALTLAYAGYSYIIMGDAMCEATINLSDKLYTPLELYQMAVTRLEEALSVAQAAKRTDIANLARVGLARAHLNLGNKAQVATHASQVPANFVWWVEYSDADPRLYNTLYSRVTGGNHSLGVHPRFLNGSFGNRSIVSTQTDPRIQHTTNWSFGHNRLTRLYKPFQSLPYSGYNGQTIATGGKPILYESGTDIKLASGLEARHHLAEAEGPTAATLAFVNERRAFGNQAAVTLSGDALMSELREQRARDMYMGGFRLGDLRRWQRQGVTDPKHSFPSGQHPTAEWGFYGEATCFPLPLEEYESNPNLPRPSGS